MFESVEALAAEYADLEERLADPSVHADQATARRLGRRYSELRPVVATYREQAADPSISVGWDLELEPTVVAPAYDGLLDFSYATPLVDQADG